MDKKPEKLVPEVRFKGFTDDWEQHKFDNVVKRINDKYDNPRLPHIEFENIISGNGTLNKTSITLIFRDMLTHLNLSHQLILGS